MFGKRLLLWDSYRCHISDSTKKQLKKLQIDTTVIPGGCTKYIQAPDVYWKAPFKAKIRQYYEDWMVHGEKTYTNSGNTRAPSVEVYLGWIVEAWKQVPSDLIERSFVECGLTIALDGSEDHKIHCFEPENEIPNGWSSLREARIRETNNVDLDSTDETNSSNNDVGNSSVDFE